MFWFVLSCLLPVPSWRAWAATRYMATLARSVWVVFDAWGSDLPDVREIFSTEAAAFAHVAASMQDADDYEQARHHFQIREWVVKE